MERRATEPDELEDLFRIDHLTTRMRRHAEGLIILSGEAPARGWRQPVPLVDVLRAAVAEVEDYTRIRVLSRTNAAVAGHAVADVIHLIAELAENATVFSPPNTPVRIQGDIVGRGFAVEIEDRGLGISAQRLAEINANLASPPQFDLSGSDRLGLFIAGQLAQRHDIKVTLQPSVFGGTTAIVLIPTALVVEEGSYERDPALTAGHPASSQSGRIGGRHAALAPPADRSGNGRSTAELDPDYAGTSLAIGVQSTAEVIDVTEAVVAGRVEPDHDARPEPALRGSSMSDDLDARVTTAELAELGLPVRVRQANLAPQLRNSGPVRPASFAPSPFGSAVSSAGMSASPSSPSGTSPSADGFTGTSPSADGFTGTSPSGVSFTGTSPSGISFTGTSPSADSVTDTSPPADSLPGTRPPGETPAGATPFADSPAGSGPFAAGAPTGIDVFAAASRRAESAGSPEAARNTVSALQRGWQLGRAEAVSVTSADPAGPVGDSEPPSLAADAEPNGSPWNFDSDGERRTD
jgi:hypothetical protein